MTNNTLTFTFMAFWQSPLSRAGHVSAVKLLSVNTFLILVHWDQLRILAYRQEVIIIIFMTLIVI